MVAPKFLSLPFDWFVLERWEEDSEESTREQHIRLGQEFAELGHRDRRPYVIRATKITNGEEEIPSDLFRPINEVPQTLLNPAERFLHESEHQMVWMRTEYGPGSDTAYAELKANYKDDYSVPFHREEAVLEDPQRYSINSKEDDLTSLFAFIPFLITSETAFYSLDAEGYDFDSGEVQSGLAPQWMNEQDRKAAGQRFVYLVDKEALETGQVLLYFPNEFGKPLYQARVKPENIADIVNYHRSLGFGLTALAEAIKDMHAPPRPRR